MRGQSGRVTLSIRLLFSIAGDFVSVKDLGGKRVLHVEGKGLTLLAEQAMIDVAHLLRPAHLQVAPLDMFTEKNTGTNLPAQIEIYSTGGNDYNFLFMAKGGGSANKSFLFQQTKALLNEERLYKFIAEKMLTLGTAACPPYHLAVVVGGTSAEFNLKTVKLASAKYLDNLPTKGNEHGCAFRDLEAERRVTEISQKIGIGAQFGGKYFCHDVRVIRLPRHGASCPVGIGVSCSADRQALGKITSEGIFVEQLETDPAKYLPDPSASHLSDTAVKINLNQPMDKVLAELSKHPVRTRVSLTGTLVVGRDIAHAKIKERLDAGEPMPEYMRNHPIYYAGPAKTPEGYASGSFGPTTAGRMDSYVDLFQSKGGSMIMLAKGNRSKDVTNACKKHGGFYLGSIGGPAAILAKNNIKKETMLMLVTADGCPHEMKAVDMWWRTFDEETHSFIRE
ncbi:unnamed protein product [Dibothriocephalus latus]|uniref:fumarate hydratase n=1 Tax=Dibothriocephalus latus TaxID=60516 RepID=A0A3P6TCN8_DIBLA|nr:unnamed protein product [Dibothriocephalus latus]